MWTDKDVADRWQMLRAERAVEETSWDLINRLLSPWQGDIQGSTTPGQNRTRPLFDSTGITALDNLAAGLYGAGPNEATVWFRLRHPDDDLMQYEPAKRYIARLERLVLRSYGPAVSNFYTQVPLLLRHVAGIGTGIFYEERAPGREVIISRAIPTGEAVFAENAMMQVDQLIRRTKMTYRAAADLYYQRAGRVPAKLYSYAERTPYQATWILHATYPNDDYREGRIGPAGMPFLSHHVWGETNERLHMGGYHGFPYYVVRWHRQDNSVWGVGQGQRVLADVNMLQAMKKTTLEAGQFAVRPPLLTTGRDALQTLRVVPGGAIHGGLSPSGRKLVEPLNNGARVDISIELVRDVREAVKDGFFFTLLQLVGRSGMTATEVLERNEEKMRLMAPHSSVVNQDLCAKSVARRIDMLHRAGQIEPPPPELSGEPLVAEFESTLASAQKSAAAAASSRLLADLREAAQLDPDVVDLFNGDAYANHMREGRGAPVDLLFGADVVAQRRKARQEKEQAAAALEAGQQGAEIVAKLGGGRAA